MPSAEPVRLTKRIVDAAMAPPSGEYTLWDSDLKGFGLRVRAGGSKIYVVKQRVHGRQFKLTIGKHGSPWTPDSARERAAQALRDATVGIDPSSEKREARTDLSVRELLELYREEGPANSPDKRPRTWEVEFSALRRHVVPLLGSNRCRQLTPEMIRKWQADVVAGKTAVDERTKARGRAIVTGGPGATARAMSALSSMLSWAVRRGLMAENPALKVKKLKQKRRNRFLSEAEAVRMFSTMDELTATGMINPAHRDAILLMALTGARPSEILGLRWSEVDLERGFAALPPERHKTGASGDLRVIQLDATALDVLRDRPQLGPFVFPDSTGAQPIKRVQDSWERIREVAGLEGTVLYTLRHSFASFAIEQGENLYVIGRAMGHRKAATTERYAHVRDALAQRVVASVGAKLASARKRGQGEG